MASEKHFNKYELGGDASENMTIRLRQSHKLVLLLLMTLQSSVYSQARDSIVVDTINSKTNKVVRAWQTRSSLGGQIGYSRVKANQFDFGLNYYWSKMRHDTNWVKPDVYHTFGPSLACIMLLKNNTTLIGSQIGINYHYYYSICPRLHLTFEDYYNHDQRLGIDLGISVLGLYANVGYHYPIGKSENVEISRFRFGLQYIFNRALMKTVEMNWH